MTSTQKYCLETTFLVDFLRGKDSSLQKYKQISKHALSTTSIVVWEILRGPKLAGRMKEYADATRLLEKLTVLPFTTASARIATNIELELKEKGGQVNLIDVLIAAVTIENNSRLVTRDEGYTHIKDLQVEFYTAK
ncbi:MAG: type II toxin-antitoxin system VapC family toxin [Candidatus Jordarchaeum sp.]|uniref:type II toxin-antitoxin system VapC family toxin n=1 Tax=Candidatus Jordarchaeum sp. TaxID=2823881 RepID=UPI00404AC386